MSLYQIFSTVPRCLRPLLVEVHDFFCAIDRFNTPKNNLLQENQSNIQIVSDCIELLKYLPSNGTVVELGVDEGEFSQSILEICQPQKLYLVDSWGTGRYREKRMRDIRTRFESEIELRQVELVQSDSLSAASLFTESSVDWVYIDTNHQYETTRKELQLYSKVVKKGGFLCGHDYTIGNFNSGIRYGVIEAVHEFCNEENWKVIYLTNECHRHLSFVLQENE